MSKPLSHVHSLLATVLQRRVSWEVGARQSRWFPQGPTALTPGPRLALASRSDCVHPWSGEGTAAVHSGAVGEALRPQVRAPGHCAHGRAEDRSGTPVSFRGPWAQASSGGSAWPARPPQLPRVEGAVLGGGSHAACLWPWRGSPCTQTLAPFPCSVLHTGRWGSHFPSNGAVVHVPWPSLSYACLFPQKAPRSPPPSSPRRWPPPGRRSSRVSEGARRPRRLFPQEPRSGLPCVLALSVFRQRARPSVEVGAPIWDLRIWVFRETG